LFQVKNQRINKIIKKNEIKFLALKRQVSLYKEKETDRKTSKEKET
jgi:hypothetical protein